MMPLLLILVALGAVLPAHLAIAGLPALWCVQNLVGDDGVLFSAGPVDIAPLDLLLVLLCARGFFVAARKREITGHAPLFIALGIFLAVNLLATLAAGIKFGEAHLLRCLTAYARLLLEVVLVLLAAQAVRTLPQARQCVQILLGTLAVLAAIQFVNYLGAAHGVTIGEVQGLERGEERYFGPVGDSVGVVLLLGYLTALCLGRPFIAVGLFLAGIFLTAGLGAIFAVVVGTAGFLLFAWQMPEVRLLARRIWWLLPLLAFAGVVLMAFTAAPLFETLLDRLRGGSVATSGSQRLDSGTMALRIAVANPLLGVGFLGFEPALERYGGTEFFELGVPDGATANANNQFLQALTDAGILGLIAFATLVFCAARLLLQISTRTADPLLRAFFLAAFLWLLAQALGNLAAVWLVPSSFVARILWIVLGLAVAVEKLIAEPAPTVPHFAPAPLAAPLATA